MKYLKKFNEQEKSIEDWCKFFKLKNYKICSESGVVDVSFANIAGLKLHEIPIQFGIVSGIFRCDNNLLTTLKGSPEKMDGSLICNNNHLITLDGCPKVIGWKFNCSYNLLKTLEGGPEKVKYNYTCHNNMLRTLEGAPEEKNIGGSFDCEDNKIHSIYEIFNSLDKYKTSLDYKYLRGNNIIERRFKAACEDAHIDMPYYAPDGYKYI
jgi:hypothetical protein